MKTQRKHGNIDKTLQYSIGERCCTLVMKVLQQDPADLGVASCMMCKAYLVIMLLNGSIGVLQPAHEHQICQTISKHCVNRLTLHAVRRSTHRLIVRLSCKDA